MLCVWMDMFVVRTPIDVAKNNEYKTLFGEQASQILSIYEHKHDHEHSHEGDIKKN